MIAAFILIAIAMAYRIVLGTNGSGFEWLPNFSPIAAMFLCGAAFFPKRWMLGALLVAMMASDIFLNVYHGFPVLHYTVAPKYLALALLVTFGLLLKNAEHKVLKVLFASFLGSIGFYLITNTASWIWEPGYAKTFSGWLQALSGGLPGYAPTWTFFRNTLLSDFLFTVIFVLCMSVGRSSAFESETAATTTATK